MCEECGKDMCHVEVSNRDVVFRLELHKGITIIRGDSGTGKTVLYELMLEYTKFEKDSGVTVSSDKPCSALLYWYWEEHLRAIHDCVVFVGEPEYYMDPKKLQRPY